MRRLTVLSLPLQLVFPGLWMRRQQSVLHLGELYPFQLSAKKLEMDKHSSLF
jgi:hypothetical protein